MQLDFLFNPLKKKAPVEDALRVGAQTIPIHFVCNHRARRYILRVQADGSVRATVPRTGTRQEARAFAERHNAWIARQLQKCREQAVHPPAWQHGTEIYYRGQKVPLQIAPNHDGYRVTFADQSVRVADRTRIRPVVERHLWRLAHRELPPQTIALAARHHIPLRRITVRDQRSRWGSSSRRGTISLNWRLIQAPDFVRTYIIIHELMHQREMNHSPRFWRHVAEACPDHQPAEAWLKEHCQLRR